MGDASSKGGRLRYAASLCVNEIQAKKLCWECHIYGQRGTRQRIADVRACPRDLPV